MNRPIVDPANASSPEYKLELEGILESGECPAPFCKDEAEYHKHPILHVGRYWKVTKNTFNSLGTENRYLLIHRKHITEISELSMEAWIELHKIINDLVEKDELDGATLICRFGATDITASSVSHLHAHLISGIARDSHSNVKKMLTAIGFHENQR